MEIINNLYNNLDYIVLTVIIIFTILVITSILDINFDLSRNSNFNGESNKIINIETMKNKNNKHKEFTNAFCSNYENDHSNLNKNSKKLNYDSCNSTRCTVWVKTIEDDICMGGDSDGPYFKGTLEKPLKIDNYYYKNKCYPGLKNCE